MTKLKRGDVVLTRSEGWVSQIIRFFTRVPQWEPPTEYNHAELVVTDGDIFSAEVVSADRGGVRRRKILPFHAKQTIEVFRVTPQITFPEGTPLDIAVAPEEYYRDAAASWIEGKVGQKYPVWRLFTWVGDWLITVGLAEVFFFRRVFRKGDRETCAALVALAWLEGGNCSVSGRRALYTSPDDIHDFMVNPCFKDYFERIEYVQS